MGGPFKSLRPSFLKEFVETGKPAESTTHSQVPRETQQKWIQKFVAAPTPRLQAQPRLLNRFTLGADPEFIFTVPRGRTYTDEETGQVYTQTRIDAANVGMKTGLAFGADQNGRLIEMRPRPNRFALKVLASCWSALKWMALMYPQTLAYSWECGAYLLDDGLGGHIHFGRKRPKREAEVAGLDRVGKLTYHLGIFPKDQWNRRRDGDTRGQRYGLWGDYRPQVHGYEYRTLPSWLDDPWIAYLCLVLSKLAVYQPDLTLKWDVQDGTNIRNLLAYYKGMDDDAALALKALELKGLPQHTGGDFKGRWGFTPYFGQTKEDTFWKHVTVVPGSIEPTETEIKELFEFLVEGKPLVARPEQPTWSPTKVPDNFRPIVEYTEVTRLAGMGEALTGLYSHMNQSIAFYGNRENSNIEISSNLASKLCSNWQEKLRSLAPKAKIRVAEHREDYIHLPESWRRVERIQLTKKLLTCGVFPIWKIKDATEETFKAWQQQPKDKKKEPTYRGTVLREA